MIRNADKRAIDSSAIDPHLSGEGYRMKNGSMKPSNDVLFSKVLQDNADRLPEQETHKLEARQTYVFRLKEKLTAKLLNQGNFFGQATAKSSVGRVDVLARLIVDGADHYEGFEPGDQITGELYVEITPMTFNVLVQDGVSLSQARFFKGEPSSCIIQGQEISLCTLRTKDSSLSLDLRNIEVGTVETAAFYVDRNDSRRIKTRFRCGKTIESLTHGIIGDLHHPMN